MRKSTNKLTKHELNFARDTTYPLMKQKVMQKMHGQFHELAQKLIQELPEHELIDSDEFKITRGENLELMPYLVMDFPRITGKNFPILCRTLFWWGYNFSCSILVQTNLLDIEKTAENLTKAGKCFILTGNNIWNNDLKDPAYLKMHKLSQSEIRQLLLQQPYLKLASVISLKKTGKMKETVLKCYSRWIPAISIKKGA